MAVGRIVSTWLERRGTSVVVAAPTGTQTIQVGFYGTDFDEQGGQLQHQPTGDVYDYSSADVDAETITLAAALPSGKSFAVDDALYVYPLANDLFANVRLDDAPEDEQPITARVSHPMRAMLPEGTRDPGTGEAVVVENTGQEWVVTDAVGAGTAFFENAQFSGEIVVGTLGHIIIDEDSWEAPSVPAVNFDLESEPNYSGHLGSVAAAVVDPGTVNERSTLTFGPPGMVKDDLVTVGKRARIVLLSEIAGSVTDPTQAALARVEGLNPDGSLTDVLTEFRDPGIRRFGQATFVQFTLQNGWVYRGIGYFPAYKKAAEQGAVLLRGQMTGGTDANGTTVATLPAGYRPNRPLTIPVAANAGTRPRVFIGTDGVIQIEDVVGTTFVSLDGVWFPQEGT